MARAFGDVRFWGIADIGACLLYPKADIRWQSQLLADGACGVWINFFENERKLRHFAGNIWEDETLYGVILTRSLIFGASDE